MANSLKITTPMSGYDNSIRPNNSPVPGQAQNIQNPVDPSKILRHDGKPEAEERSSQNNMSLLYDSNFGNFVQSLRDVPVLSEFMPELVFNAMNALTDSGITSTTSEEILAFLSQLQMTDEEFATSLKEKLSASNRFHGTFFDIIRETLNNVPTVELRSAILDFLKKYNDMSSGSHIMKMLKQQLADIQGHMFRDAGDKLAELAQRLHHTNNGDTQANAQILKEDIIPFLGTYISRTKDLGHIRDLIGNFVMTASRYENGDSNGVLQAYKFLQRFPSFNRFFKGLDSDQLFSFLEASDSGDIENTTWENNFVNIMNAALKGEAGFENKQMFEALMNSILVNESVYMPLQHLIIPAEVEGNKLFSELWIDPDENANGADGEKAVRMLIKFSVDGVGAFDLIMYYTKSNAEVQLLYPSNFNGSEEQMRTDIAKIFKDNNINCNNLALTKSSGSVPVEAVFPKIFERRNSVNVTV